MVAEIIKPEKAYKDLLVKKLTSNKLVNPREASQTNVWLPKL